MCEVTGWLKIDRKLVARGKNHTIFAVPVLKILKHTYAFTCKQLLRRLSSCCKRFSYTPLPMVRSSRACSKGCIRLQAGNPLTTAPRGTAISLVRASSLRAERLRACCNLPLIFLLPCSLLAFLRADLMWSSEEGTCGMRWNTPAKFSTLTWGSKLQTQLTFCYNKPLWSKLQDVQAVEGTIAMRCINKIYQRHQLPFLVTFVLRSHVMAQSTRIVFSMSFSGPFQACGVSLSSGQRVMRSVAPVKYLLWGKLLLGLLDVCKCVRFSSSYCCCFGERICRFLRPGLPCSAQSRRTLFQCDLHRYTILDFAESH